MTTANAEEVLMWVQKHDHVAITSYIEEQWRLYRTSATRDPKKPEKVFYAEWIRDFYYFHLNAFYKSGQSVGKIHDSILLFFHIPGAGSPLFTETRKFAESLQENQLPAFFEYVEFAFRPSVFAS